MRYKTLLVTPLLFLVLLCCKESKDSEIKIITVEEMDSLLDMDKVQLIDVRTPQEYNEGHIKGAINIDFRDKDFEKQILEVDKSKTVIVYCKEGLRSSECADFMKKSGFIKIYDLKGGITEWAYSGKPITK